MLDLRQQIAQLSHGDHVCLLYKDRQEQMAAVIPYAQAGFDCGERFIYITDDLSPEDVLAELSTAGIDLPHLVNTGQMFVLTKHDAYPRTGAFDPLAMIAFCQQAIDDALAAGFTGLRVTGEMTWVPGSGVCYDQLIEYEALLNTYIFRPGNKTTGLCQYNIERLPPAVVEDVLRTHPVAVVGGQVCPNLYCEPPEMVLGRASKAERATWAIDQLKAARIREQTEIAERQRLAEEAHIDERRLGAMVRISQIRPASLQELST